jgi:hypothetical protein
MQQQHFPLARHLPRLCYERVPSVGARQGYRGHKPAGLASHMNIFDLTKATVVCGGVAFLIYSFPVLSQILTIGLLSVLWLGYAYRAITNVRRKSGA